MFDDKKMTENCNLDSAVIKNCDVLTSRSKNFSIESLLSDDNKKPSDKFDHFDPSKGTKYFTQCNVDERERLNEDAIVHCKFSQNEACSSEGNEIRFMAGSDFLKNKERTCIPTAEELFQRRFSSEGKHRRFTIKNK